jgi:hypothetical protein
MPASTYRPRSSITSLGRMDSRGAAIRRGDLKISDPVQLPHDVNPGINEQLTAGTLSNPTETSTPQPEGNGPRKSVPPSFHARTRSNGGPELQSQLGAPNHATYRISAVPSMLNGSLTGTRSKGSLKRQKDGGLRAKISRMFGSRRLRETTLSTCPEVHHSHPVSTSTTPSSLHHLRNLGLLVASTTSFSYCFGMHAPYRLSSSATDLQEHAPRLEKQTRLMHIRILPILHQSKVRTTGDRSEHLLSMLANLQD